jgi:hypothetical protein
MTVAEEVAVRRVPIGIGTGGTFAAVVALEEGFGCESYPDQTLDEAKERLASLWMDILRIHQRLLEDYRAFTSGFIDDREAAGRSDRVLASRLSIRPMCSASTSTSP